MMHRSLRLAMLPAILASVAGCATATAPTASVDGAASTASATQSAAAPTQAAIVFGSCAQRPVYPEAAKRENRQGTVSVSFHIDADTTVLDSKVTRGSGHADLDEAARVGLAKCKFTAATQDGRPIRGWATVQYVWAI